MHKLRPVDGAVMQGSGFATSGCFNVLVITGPREKPMAEA